MGRSSKCHLQILFRWVLPALLIVAVVVWRLFFFVYRLPVDRSIADEREHRCLLMSRLGDPEPGDYVLVSLPDSLSTASSLLLRVAAMPSDTLRFKTSPTADRERRESCSMTVCLGDDEYWLLGDSSEYALDSRYLGPISREWIKATAVW